MKWSVKIIGLSLFMTACTVKPEAIRYGKDACDFCRMTIMDSRFGGEIVTKKGKTYKFDAVECLVGYYKVHLSDAKNFAVILVSDYSHPGKMLDAKQAIFLKDEKIRSPMGAHLAAFPDTKAARQLSEDHRIIFGWNNLLKLDR